MVKSLRFIRLDSEKTWPRARFDVGNYPAKAGAIDAMKSVAEQDYQDLVQLLDRLTDEVEEDENHPLASLMDVLGVLIEKYEDEHVPELAE